MAENQSNSYHAPLKWHNAKYGQDKSKYTKGQNYYNIWYKTFIKVPQCVTASVIFTIYSNDRRLDEPVKWRTVSPRHNDLGVCLRPLDARYTMS